MSNTCLLCPAPSGRNRYCPAHREAGRERQRLAAAAWKRDQWGRWKAAGEDPTHGGAAAAGRAEKIRAKNLAGEAGRQVTSKQRREERT